MKWTCIVLALALALAATGCKKKDEGGGGGGGGGELCTQIFQKRIESPIKSFRENGPKNKDAFLKFCATLPKDYLECEAMSMEDLQAAGEAKTKECIAMRQKHQESLNRVLERGEATAAKPDPTPAPATGGGGADAKQVFRDDEGCKKTVKCCADAKAAGLADVVKLCEDAMSFISEKFIETMGTKPDQVAEICGNHRRAARVKIEAAKQPMPESCGK